MKPVSGDSAERWAFRFAILEILIVLFLAPIPIIFYIRYLVWLWRVL